MDVITYLFHPQEKGHYLRRREGEKEGEGETARQQTGWGGGSKMSVELQHTTKCQWVGDKFPTG